MKKLNCLVVGAGFANKGAYLMLVSVAQQIKQRSYGSHVNLFVSPLIDGVEESTQLGFKFVDHPLLHVSHRRFATTLKWGGVIKYFDKKYRGDIDLGEIDIIFDVTGFGFTDQWGPLPCANLRELVKYAKKKGIRYILMPQAFGPFKNPLLRESITDALSMVDLIFAREEQSEGYLNSLPSKEFIVHRAPDITIPLGAANSQPDNYCCLVPNIRNLDQGKEDWGQRYEEILIETTCNILDHSHLHISIIVHDKGDFELANDVIASVPEEQKNRVSVVDEDDPVVLKSYIGNSQFLIGSRFHAIVGALSCSVPSLALGWSHKYDLLLAEYDLPAFSFTEPSSDIPTRVKTLLHAEQRQAIRNSLYLKNSKMVQKNEKMWKEIDKIVGCICDLGH